MIAYYNEFDPKAAAWLRELVKHGHIVAGRGGQNSDTGRMSAMKELQ